MSNVQEAIDQIKEGLDALAAAVGGSVSDDNGDATSDVDEPWTEEQLKALERDDLLAAAEAAGVEVKKGQKASTIVPAILAKQEADAASSGDEPDNDDPDVDPDPDDKKSKKDKKKSKKSKKGAGKSKGRGKS